MNAEQYNLVVQAHSHNLYRFLLKLIKNKDEANDLVQDAYLKLWENREKVEKDKAKSWLFITGRNAMLNQLKRDKRMESMHLNNLY